MLRGYRRRFVAINMALIALVLALALGMQVAYVYRSEYADLQKTMGLILEPWRGAGFRPQEARPSGEESPKPPPGRDRIGNERMITVFYDREGGEMHVLPEERPMDRDTVALAAEAAAARTEDFGHLPEYNLYYKKQGADSDLRIVLADSAYLSSRVWRSALALLGVYVLALGLFFLISLRLSRLAARPLEQAVEMERQFVADISHDLKTPITVVLANNAILRSAPEATVGEQAQWIDSTGDAARSMMDMVEQMLTLSSLESAGPTMEKRPVNLSACAEKSVLQLESLAYDRGVTLRDDVAPGVSVLGDVQRPGQIQATGERLTIFEALSMVGDLTIYGQRTNIVVIREENGKRVIGEIDLTSQDVFESPYYYLHQNDVVYVEPNKKRKRSADYDPVYLTYISTGVSVLSLLISAYYYYLLSKRL